MNYKWIYVLVTFIAVVSLTGCSREPAETATGASAARAPASAAKGITAKVALAQVRERVKGRQADAHLVVIETVYADRTGRVVPLSLPDEPATFWFFHFGSKKAGPSLRVFTNGEKTKTQDEPQGQWVLFKALPDDFAVDSDAAMAEAIRNGYQPQEDNYMKLTFRLFIEDDDLPEPAWVTGAPGETNYVVSATTGKLSRKVEPPKESGHARPTAQALA